jgi:hypothetical protein
MKNTLSILVLLLGLGTVWCQESNQTPFLGENFSLEGALAMLKKANSLKQFERLINDRKNNVTNLDLNADGEIDYITVEDLKNEDTHVLVLSTLLNETEKQDVATISIEKTGESEVYLQIEGDAELYAANTIVEPTEEKETLQDAKGGPNTSNIIIQTMAVNVWSWPCIHYMYSPKYVIWVSPYRWNFRPNWWRPWRPFAFNVFFVKCAPHRLWFHSVGTRRMISAKKTYASIRHTSALVVRTKKGVTIAREITRGTRIKNIPNKRVRLNNTPIYRGLSNGVRSNGNRRR